MVAGQFRGMDWRYRAFYEKGQVPGQNYHKSWRKSWQDAFIFQSDAGREEVRRAMEDMPKAQFQVEYECLPIANIAAVFLTEDYYYSSAETCSPSCTW